MKTRNKSSAASSDKRGPINKRTGRCVCVCTAKGKIIYMEDQFEYNKQQQRR